MSSAAVQQSVAPPYSPISSSRDRYASNPSANFSSSPPSSRRAGRQSSSGNGSSTSTPQQVPYASSDTMNTPRGANMPATSSPTAAMSESTYHQFYPGPASQSPPPSALPIRASAPADHSSPVSAYDGRGHNVRASQQQQQPGAAYGSESERERASDSDRRRSQRSQREDSEQPSSGRSQRTRPPPVTSRSTNAVGQTPVDTSLPRENSAIINHIVVDDPQSDIARERARVAEARPQQAGAPADLSAPGLDHGALDTDRAPPGQRSRQEYLKQASAHRSKEVKFGDYILGQTLGEGEFGKVKMGWKKDSSVQVAIKLIRKESLAGNATRLPKIYREIAILRELQHPNIVRLHEFVETERHMGIILEYASGGELFDYILNHRYLKDPAARRLFAQLVSGVGYLHQKGIVHRDLKLENLLLDRNRNIIITDFGFANTFSPHDELGEETERRITDKEFVKARGLDVVGADGHRRGDLMQTSCGSPCYAAPELVVSDGLYTGRKVDVWSCGVILYAMLAGYLPFDDDPANPEGDNINLLYKYIVSTPLTFPEYVTPHARDLLRRILVPEPRRRADLFEVARHSWLSEYSHVVGFIGSSSKTEKEGAGTATQQDEEPSALGRSASVREPTSRIPTALAAGGSQKKPAVTSDDFINSRNAHREAKRRTVQLEYVAPAAGTTRGETGGSASLTAPAAASSAGKTRARGDEQGPTEVSPLPARVQSVSRKEVPRQSMPPPTRPVRDSVRTVSETNSLSNQPATSASRPPTGSLGGAGARLPSRGNSYSQPVAATPTTMNAQGHFSQPKSSTGYIISSPIPQDQGVNSSRPISEQHLNQVSQQQQQQQQRQQEEMAERSHKRSSTLSSLGDRILGRNNSRRKSQQQAQDSTPTSNEKKDRKYPPVSMKNPMPNNNDQAGSRRQSSESRRSFGFSRKNSDVPSERRNSRRFSWFSVHSFTGKKDQPYDSVQPNATQESPVRNSRPPSKGMAFGRGKSPTPSQSTTNSTIPLHYDADREATRAQRRSGMVQSAAPQNRDSRYDKALPPQPGPPEPARKQFRDDGFGGNRLDDSPPERFYTPAENNDQRSPQGARPDQYNPGGGRGQQQQQQQPQQQQYQNIPKDGYEPAASGDARQQGAQQIRPQQRKFENAAYDQGHGGSSRAANRVMDFFRRRGKDRTQA